MTANRRARSHREPTSTFGTKKRPCSFYCSLRGDINLSIAMASLPLCSSCRKVVQERIYLPFQLQPYPEHYILRRLYRPIRDVRRYAAQAASSPVPYQQKKVADTGKSAASESTLPTNKSTSTKSKHGTVEGSSTSTTESIAASVRKNLPGVAETYVAYSSSEKLVRECGRQAQYSIPQSKEKNAEIPKTKYGAQLGVGDGWWYSSMFSQPLAMSNAVRHMC